VTDAAPVPVSGPAAADPVADGTPVSAPPAGPASDVGRAAAGIAVVTAAGRGLGFLRTAASGRVLGATALGDAYTAANLVPNVLFDVTAGGVLTAVVVPLVGRDAAAGAVDRVSRTASALFTYVAVVLVPLAVVVAVCAHPLAELLLAGAPPASHGDEVAGATRMLRLFAPQVVLYGVGVVAAGLLQAHRRFLAPAVAPALSSVVVIAAYLAFAVTGGTHRVAALATPELLLLAGGTTLGVVALSLPLLVPLRSLGLRLRPTLRLEPAARRSAVRLAGAGVAAVAAQQCAAVVAVRLAAGRPGGALVVTLAQTVLLVPWAVLAVPVATSCFPVLVTAPTVEAYAGVLRAAGLRLLLAVSLGVALLAAAAEPLSHLVLSARPGAAAAGAATLRWAIVAGCPGVIGYGVVALAGRALYAGSRTAAAAVITAGGWLTAAVLALVAAGLGVTVGPTVVEALWSVGLCAAGLVAVALLGRRGVAGPPRVALAALAGAAAGGLAGALAAAPLAGTGGPARAVAGGAVATVAATAAWLAVLAGLGGPDLRGALRSAGARATAAARRRRAAR
jgi:putative peptidoglycan lipid II flippase